MYLPVGVSFDSLRVVLRSGKYYLSEVKQQTYTKFEKDNGEKLNFVRLWLYITLYVNIFFFALNLISREFSIWMNVVAMLYAGFCYMLYYSRFRYKTNFALFIFYCAQITFYTVVSDYSTGMFLYYFVLFALSVLLFQSDKVRVFTVCVALIAAISSLYFKGFVTEYVTYESTWRKFVHFGISIFVIFTAIWRYARIAEEALDKKDDLIDEVNKKNVELERFAYITSHDLKQPVRNISSYAGLLEKNLLANTRLERSLEYTQFIKSSSKSLEQLIDDILKLSKLGTEDFVSEEVDLNKAVCGIVKSLDLYIKSKNGTVEFNNLPTLQSSGIYVTLLFQNLIENGIKYNKSGQPHVKVTHTELDDNHLIKVTDNGLGIKEEYFKLIFQPFKRLHSNREFQGSGLGLSICKKIIDVLGGQITLKSEEGKGSEFNILLPKAKEV